MLNNCTDMGSSEPHIWVWHFLSGPGRRFRSCWAVDVLFPESDLSRESASVSFNQQIRRLMKRGQSKSTPCSPNNLNWSTDNVVHFRCNQHLQLVHWIVSTPHALSQTVQGYCTRRLGGIIATTYHCFLDCEKWEYIGRCSALYSRSFD